MDREVLKNALINTLPNLTLDEFARLFMNETLAIEEFYKLCSGVKSCYKVSLLFNPHRLDTPTSSSISIYQAIKDPKLLSGLARMYLYDLTHNAPNPLYHSLQRGFNGIQYVNEFQPIVAHKIYKTYAFAMSKEPIILDPCCGWGGRMLGCASFPNTTYIGCEPSTKTYEGLIKLGEWIQVLQPTFKFKIYNVPYEDFETDMKFDFALTSPPYFDTEHYSTEETNSFNRYPEFDNWYDNFYVPLVYKTMNFLKDDACFVINIGDRKYPLTSRLQKTCDDNGFNCQRIDDYLSGTGEAKEKFYMITKSSKIYSTNHIVTLF